MTVDNEVFSPAESRPPVIGRIYSLFARVLDYPGNDISGQVKELAMKVGASNSEAAESLRKFQSELQAMPLGQVQELYTSTFDMRPDRTTNLGCHLFGEDVRRNLFMAQLKVRMEARHIVMGSELPDHLSLVLQLLATEDSEDEARTLIGDCLSPAVARILLTFEENPNPYANALQALAIVLNQERAAAASRGTL